MLYRAKLHAPMTLTNTECEVYKRQMIIDRWGTEVQERLKQSTVFVAGAGGLGSPASIYLAVAGVGHLSVCDFDSPEWSNLNRQILHDASRIGMNKALSAKKTLERLNTYIQVTALSTRIEPDSVDRLVGDAQIILDCMDNYDTRYVLNACALRKRIPLLHGSIRGWEGRLAFLQPPDTPCLRCIVPEAPPREVFPVVGATPGVIGTLQAVEALKYLAGIPTPLKGRLLVWDGEAMETKTFDLKHDPHCVDCARIALDAPSSRTGSRVR